MKLYHTTEKMIDIKHPESMKASEDWTDKQTDNGWHQKKRKMKKNYRKPSVKPRKI